MSKVAAALAQVKPRPCKRTIILLKNPMPRHKFHTNEQIVDRALNHFWMFGYAATSMDALVSSTNVSRQGIYSAFGGKHALFLACLAAYQRKIVTHAFAQVEAPAAALKDIAAYFHQQIDLAENTGLPGLGCFIANTLTERAPHDAAAMAVVRAHHNRLRNGFANALSNAATKKISAATIDELSGFLLMSATGLWSLSRSVDNAGELRSYANTALSLVEQRIG